MKSNQKVDSQISFAHERIKKIDEILARLSLPQADITWVGKNYSKLDLINDLKSLQEDL